MIAEAKPRTDPHEEAAIDLEREADVMRCGALREFWYVACLATELKDKPLARTILGVPIALFRDPRGRAAAVRDRCLHRGTALSGGVVIDGKLACPYHGWMYGADGRCVHIPSLGERQRGSALSDVEHQRAGLELAPEDVGCLASYPVREQDGLVYVYLGESVPGHARPPRKEPFPIPFWGHPDWTVYFMVTPFSNGVTNLVENFMDVPHTVFVHSGWFRNAARKKVPASVERVNGSVLVTYRQERDRISGLGFILNPTGKHAMVHTDKFYVPNTTRVDYTFGEQSGFIITSQCTPIGPTESMVYTAISVRLPFDAPGRPIGRVLEPLIHWYTRRVIEQDVDIMKEQQRGLVNGPEPVRFASTEADLLHADIEAYRRWLLQGGEGEGPQDAARDIEFWI
jgi:phenylpropionate dioxygenase-like ring-hydroxylating dioxygenase large terminal subunit